MDYVSKTYSDPVRDAATAGKLKPHQQPAEEGGGEGQRAKVSRSSSTIAKVITTEEKKRVDVSFILLFHSPMHLECLNQLEYV